MNQLKLNDQWTRSEDGWVAGVCQGLAERFDMNAGALRLLWLFSVLFFGVGFLVYFIFALCLPVEGREEKALQPKFLGVCLRLSERTGLDVGLLRVITILIGIGSFGTTALAYILANFLIPRESA